MYIRKNIKHEESTVSLNALIEKGDSNSFKLSDILTDGYDYENEAISKINIENVINSCDDLSRKIVSLKISGLSNTKIGEELNYTQGYVSKRIRKLKEQYKNLSAGEIIY